MAPMQKKVEKKGAKKKMIMVEVKKEIEKHDRGMRVAEISRFYKKSTSVSRLQRRRTKDAGIPRFK